MIYVNGKAISNGKLNIHDAVQRASCNGQVAILIEGDDEAIRLRLSNVWMPTPLYRVEAGLCTILAEFDNVGDAEIEFVKAVLSCHPKDSVRLLYFPLGKQSADGVKMLAQRNLSGIHLHPDGEYEGTALEALKDAYNA